jgi:glycosyltransferase A (GT-A) superfamily protein (DUF2064 family)
VRCLGILVQAPIPGRVKTRLAADVGDSTAAEVHWQIGRRVVGQSVAPGYRTTVWYTPASEGAFVREWLEGLGRFELRARPAGQFGERNAHAFARHFAEGARQVVIVDGDCPSVDRRIVRDAFTALSRCDVAVGPTTAGGCYLIGLNEPRPALLRGLRGPAFGPPPLAQLKSRARGMGLILRVLRPLRDVRTLQDARLLGLLKTKSTLDQT